MIEQEPLPFPNTLIVSYLEQIYYIDLDRNPNIFQDFNSGKTPDFVANSVVKADMDFYIFGVNADKKIIDASKRVSNYFHSKAFINSLLKSKHDSERNTT